MQPVLLAHVGNMWLSRGSPLDNHVDLPRGKILDVDYQHTTTKHNLSTETSNNLDLDLDHFSAEEARLRNLKYSLLVCGLLIVGYGQLL
ncbi:hypothetical protein GGR58DRAFT_186233 [Xylaria digitata]|nr:hypothetical protein GGR58DRAFT_186233 [Xylaria digitata]